MISIAAGGGNDVVDGGANGAAGDVVVYSGARSNYTVTVQGGSFVITDNRTGPSDGIDAVTNVERFEFADRTVTAAELIDTTGPVLTAATPADNATAVAAGNNIVLTFSEAVAAGSGNIVISNGAGDTRTIAIGDASQVTISGNTVTINPTADLAAGAAYDVTLASGVITDVAGNAFGGIAQNALDFTVAAPQNYRLQLLHFSDGEASLLATKTAKNLAALVDAFEDQFANTLVLSGGDNFLAGPFLSAGTDPSVRAAINAASGSTIAAGVNVPIAAADISILNAIGVEASTIGNHEFDLGSRVLRDAFTPGSVAGYSGANFVYLSSNLDFSGDADLNPRYTNTVGKRMIHPSLRDMKTVPKYPTYGDALLKLRPDLVSNFAVFEVPGGNPRTACSPCRRAASSARASARASRSGATSPRPTPTSSSRCSARSSAWSGRCW